MPDEGFKKRLILADGTVLEDCDCGYSNKSLWCFLKGIPFGEAFQYFSSPTKFQTVIFELEYMDFIDRFEYSGFEEITSVVQSENTVDVRLEGYKIETNKSRIIKNDPSNESGE
jgi:hypothetical protein